MRNFKSSPSLSPPVSVPSHLSRRKAALPRALQLVRSRWRLVDVFMRFSLRSLGARGCFAAEANDFKGHATARGQGRSYGNPARVRSRFAARLPGGFASPPLDGFALYTTNSNVGTTILWPRKTRRGMPT
jgi:hypothetical protein